MKTSLSFACWRCTKDPGDFIHVFWSCPAIRDYWSQVVSVVQDIVGIDIAPTPQTCLLGLVEELAPKRAERTLIGLLLFYARKITALCWKKRALPQKQVNNVLPLYKETYQNRGCPKKYDRVWAKWLAKTSTATADWIVHNKITHHLMAWSGVTLGAFIWLEAIMSWLLCLSKNQRSNKVLPCHSCSAFLTVAIYYAGWHGPLCGSCSNSVAGYCFFCLSVYVVCFIHNKKKIPQKRVARIGE